MHSSNFSSSDGSTEDLFRDSIDSCDNDITEKVGPGWAEVGLDGCMPLGVVGSVPAAVWGPGRRRPSLSQEVGMGGPYNVSTHPPALTTFHVQTLGGPGRPFHSFCFSVL